MFKLYLKNHQKRYSQLFFCVIFSIFFLLIFSSEASEKEKNTENKFADVISVQVTGKPKAYTFSVGVKSPDTGCDQYADWWEALSEDGKLVYRRILLHSHVNEQPFVRSGGPVAISRETVVWIRAHISTAGYGGKAFKGTVKDGFQEAEYEADFAADVEKEAPQPDGCAF